MINNYKKFPIKIFGIDFTSAPSKRKTLVCAEGYGKSRSILTVKNLKYWDNFKKFEELLIKKGPWIGGFDFPFGLPIVFLNKINLPLDWKKYVNIIGKLTKKELEQTVIDFKSVRPKGQKDLPRITDSINRAKSPLKTINPPLIKMFYEGAKRLLDSGISVIPFHLPKDDRIAFETYPALLTRLVVNSYKSESAYKNKEKLKASRQKILDGILSSYLIKNLGFSLNINDVIKKIIIEDNSGDSLDSVLCCIQAYWAFLQDMHYVSFNSKIDPKIKSEGWIISPKLPPSNQSKNY